MLRLARKSRHDQKNPEPQDKTKTISIEDQSGKSRDALIADMATGGILNSASLVTEFSKGYLGDVSLTDCAEALKAKAKAVHGGDLKNIETLLTTQALALDSIFSSMAMRAKLNMGEYMNAAEKYMRLALKAQGQCRATLETLAAIKNPQPYIQNNKAQYQQVNNGMASSEGNYASNTRAHAHAGKNQKTTNGLLTDGRADYETVDFGGAGAASGDDTELEAVEV
ncbi:MAG TPA: hypothetical protein PKX87_02690 [Alphaproteobacteria bacterium]|nr:hypothetical protein [Alphaproteobacteria bacterium]